jgi:protein-disulfide isomerase
MKCNCELCKRHKYFDEIIKKYKIDKEDTEKLDNIALYFMDKETEYQMKILQLLQCMKDNLKILYDIHEKLAIKQWPNKLSEQLQQTQALIERNK